MLTLEANCYCFCLVRGDIKFFCPLAYGESAPLVGRETCFAELILVSSCVLREDC